MGPIKSFDDLKESILKLRENFNSVFGKNQFLLSPLKKKDLLTEFDSGLGGSQAYQKHSKEECIKKLEGAETVIEEELSLRGKQELQE